MTPHTWNYSIMFGCTEDVEWHLQFGNVVPSSVDMLTASTYGFADIVALLLNDGRADPNFDTPMTAAALSGHETVVKLLLADVRVDPSGDDNAAIRHAATRGFDRVVRLLVQDARIVLDERTLANAVACGRFGVVRVLLTDPRVSLRVTSALCRERVAEGNVYTTHLQILRMATMCSWYSCLFSISKGVSRRKRFCTR